MAATAAACKGIWLKNLLSKIMNMNTGPVVLYIDNRSAINLAINQFLMDEANILIYVFTLLGSVLRLEK